MKFMLNNIIYVLTLKKIPELHWSSEFEYNLKPKKLLFTNIVKKEKIYKKKMGNSDISLGINFF